MVGAVGATDYGSNAKPGLVQGYTPYGIFVNSSNGIMSIVGADSNAIDAKKDGYRAITPLYLDYAVKVGITTNTKTLTDEEKAAAQTWLGIVAPKLYEHRITIMHNSNEISDNETFEIYLKLYRRTSDKITSYIDIISDVKFGVCQNFGFGSFSSGSQIPIMWKMEAFGNISISYYIQGGTFETKSFTTNQYTITDTVKEI